MNLRRPLLSRSAGWVRAWRLCAGILLTIASLVMTAEGQGTGSSDGRGAGAIVRLIRVGTHPSFVRIVVELDRAAEWSLEKADAGIRILVPGARLADGVVRPVVKGPIMSIEPAQRGGGVEVVLLLGDGRVQVKTMTLASPDRIVVDMYEAPVVAQVAPSPAPDPVAPPPLVKPPSQSRTRPPPAGVPEASKAKAAEPKRRAKSPPSESDPAPIAPAGIGGSAGEREVSPRPLVIVLDPGHGGHDTGAIGPTGLVEKHVALDLALRLRRLLTDRLGVQVLMTRAEDVFVPLPDRAALANRAKADFFISLHVNGAGQRGAVGFETFFFSREPSDNDARASTQRENLILDGSGPMGGAQESLLKTILADMAVTRDMRESSDLAERLLAALDNMLRVENRGVKSGPFYVLATAAMPAVLVESAFITNPREERRLQSEKYRQQIAEALCEGVAAYKARYEQRLGLARPVSAGARS
jgi:N-acetylmuramoyl-L-alanine amidase